MSETVARGIRFTKDQMMVLEYLAAIEQGGENWAEVVRNACEHQIDFDALQEPARLFFERQTRSIEQERRSIN